MRQITEHHDGHGLNDGIVIEADQPGPGGASHFYLFHTADLDQRGDAGGGIIQFQKGPRSEPGSIPGITEAALYAILLDRLRGFQAGPYACPENARQIAQLEAALAETKARADARAARGVLGRYAK